MAQSLSSVFGDLEQNEARLQALRQGVAALDTGRMPELCHVLFPRILRLLKLLFRRRR